MNFHFFVDSVVSDLVALGCNVTPDLEGYVSRWRVGDIGVDLFRRDESIVLLRLVGPGISVVPVAYPMTLRGVRNVATAISAALDVPA